ncbi:MULTISPECIES: NeuD/PglB/VioB family sugar acetyltransferase [Bacteroides]|jgi:sugar O-acyltransferase (sialic acid O-acetyltransferase NeuD family)|uniref:NeuD/PglB/VioB family sugar acetyltransferase n=1 Tax=Bacteroides TaxID=816 RepID=UPI000E49A3FA|nr:MULTISPECIES: NeuD/PglB/VioB family sugar acetyltransferase [Bacteroides]MBS6563317.1 NeuD/PglB/VioB family sugar acetyltransferase [Staphylococcus sp.]RHL05875.1 serine acetyltransferase [Bacteroides sp. AF39-11AC]
MKDIAVYGAGGFGREVACIIKKCNEEKNRWNFIGFFDDGKPVGSENEYGKILGGIETLNSWNGQLDIVIAIGTPKIVRTVFSSITNTSVEFPNIISPDCLWLDKEKVFLGKGNIVMCGCIISCNIHIGDFNILNCGVSIGHDARIGNFNSMMPAARISGFDEIGDGNFLGVSSILLQGIKVGENVTVGANSVLMKDAKNSSTYLGNPAKIIF